MLGWTEFNPRRNGLLCFLLLSFFLSDSRLFDLGLNCIEFRLLLLLFGDSPPLSCLLRIGVFLQLTHALLVLRRGAKALPWSISSLVIATLLVVRWRFVRGLPSAPFDNFILILDRSQLLLLRSKLVL